MSKPLALQELAREHGFTIDASEVSKGGSVWIGLPAGFQTLGGEHFIEATRPRHARDLIMRWRNIMKPCPDDCACRQ